MSVDQATGSVKLDALLMEHPLPSWRLFAWPIMILLAALGPVDS